ncbi:hypothetical protein [Flavobacterium sp.]|uniref:hypothetical protein n=1 Tax=Flavobacterium sp. TaxID=239 RepID=UPI00263A3424|nr:hypothetical protein [Flavobacterium sp.]MDD3005860.1 hypothetical protein [Flavobacterium sp.]
MKKLYVKIFKRDYCLEGFPKNVKTQLSFLRKIRKKGGEYQFVKCHYNSEKGSAKLHTIMLQLESEKYINITYGTGKNGGTHEVLFLIKLTTKGVDRIKVTYDRLVALLTLVFIFATFMLGLFELM